MAARHVLKIPRSDEEGSFIILQVSTDGPVSRPLNLKLVATEGSSPYVLTLKHTHIDRLKGKNVPCSEDEWEQILLSVLLDKAPIEDIDTTATVKEGSSVTITFQKRIESITQRLGSLSLACKPDEDVDIFYWCDTALESRGQLRTELAHTKAQVKELEEAVNELKGQLDEFIAAKDEHETSLLESFRDLLNEKKLKIREQQRIIDAAGVKSARSEGSPSPSLASGVPELSRATKRKAASKDDDSEDDADVMEVDEKKEGDEELSEDQRTTDDDVTGSEMDEDVEDADDTTSPPRRQPAGKKGTAAMPQPSPPPPQRSLAARSKQPATKAQPKSEPPAGSETESDDEL